MEISRQARAGDEQALPTSPYLSIIIPAYNEERRLPATLDEIAAFLAAQPYTAEVIVVENGSTDATADVVRAAMATGPYPPPS
jgi:dolichyl-phosphate beta-glucosyltransferase